MCLIFLQCFQMNARIMQEFAPEFANVYMHFKCYTCMLIVLIILTFRSVRCKLFDLNTFIKNYKYTTGVNIMKFSFKLSTGIFEIRIENIC